MADELDRVRISAAELRAEASNLTARGERTKEKRENKRQRQKGGRRPDLERYQPAAGPPHKYKDSADGEASPPTGSLLNSDSGRSPDDAISEPDTPPSVSGSTHSDHKARRVCASQQYSDLQDSEPKDPDGMKVTQDFGSRNDVKSSVSSSPKQSRKARKPDREIYQPGGRRCQTSRDSGAGKDTENTFNEDEKPESGPGKEKEEKFLALEELKVHENKQDKRNREANRKRESGKQGKKADRNSDALHEDHSPLESVTSRVENLSISDHPVEDKGKKDNGAQEAWVKGRKAGNEGRRSRAGGGSEGSGGLTEKAGEAGGGKKRERGNRRSRGGEKGKRGQGEERGKFSEVAESQKDKWTSETGSKNTGKGKERDKCQELDREASCGKKMNKKENVRDRDGETASRTKTVTASKRYSQSDIRRPRNRAYSTSSASSGTSLDGGSEADKNRRGAEAGGRNRAETGSAPRAAPASKARLDQRPMDRLTAPRQRRWTASESTDSLEDGEMWERKGERRGWKRMDGEETRSPERRPKRGGGSRGTAAHGGRGGILKVPTDKQPRPLRATSGSSEDQHKKQNKGPHGQGRGILVLPSHTNLAMSSEPGPKLFSWGRGGMGLGRGRGGRGGGTRRLWDPNNPDQKPALMRSQHGPQKPLYLQQHGVYGPLHFLDTDDEVAGSPPVQHGEHLQNHQAAAMAYYKFQNSDNPYCFSLPANSSGTPPRYPYPMPFQMPSANGVFPSQGLAPFYGAFGQGAQGYPPSGTTVTPEEVEVQARGELGKLLRLADSQELQLSNLLSRDRLSPEGLDRMAQLRADLLTLYERVILTNIEFSDSQNLDQALWKNVFYQVIERFRQLLKEPTSDTSPRIRNMLLTLLDEGAVFFDALLQKLQTVFQFKLENYMDGVAIRARPLRKTVKYALISAQRCMICQGDIARYREQATDSANYGKARSWYLKAQQIAPKNGRPYNQLALLAVYTKRKLDAVYYYMRSLAASNPILTAKESLMSLFEEAKRKADQVERRRQQASEGGYRGPTGRGAGGGGTGTGRGEEATRVEIWVRPSGPTSSSRPGSESGKDSEQDGELGTLSASDLNKRFILSFLYTHGKLFTKVGMETFPAVASRVLQEFRALLQHSPSPLGNTRMLQITTINMFTIYNTRNRDGTGDVRSMLQEQSTALGLAMFGLMVQRCTELLRETPAEPMPMDECDDSMEGEVEGMVRVSSFPSDLRELLPSVKVWSDWMLGHPDQWNPPPSILGSSPDVWECLAELCNALARVYHGEAPLYKAECEEEDGADEELRLLLLEEDRLLAGFVPLLAAPQEPSYIDRNADTSIAADCKRVTVLKYFLEALCGQEEPLIAFKGGKYISMATPTTPSISTEVGNHQRTESQSSDVIVEEESSQSGSEVEVELEAEFGEGSEDDIRELRARRQALTHKLAQQQKRKEKIQAVLQTCRQLELEVLPVFLVPDTNCFIDHLEGLRKLIACGFYIIVVPLIVITELDGLAKGQESREGGVAGIGGAAHSRLVQERAKAAVVFLEQGFEAKKPCLRALTSRGNQLDSIALRSEDNSGHKGNNDDVILSCCLHYCKDKAKDFMPAQRDGPIRLRREVVLLTDDRNLRVKALTRNVPVRDIPAFLRWAQVG
ncbi:telomerase-binding protein EST1A isoform X1 [Denticeps clupeoides]|nr:telomerase-binding protein EST1A isoform X1 [Denticeps clupeoides]